MQSEAQNARVRPALTFQRHAESGVGVRLLSTARVLFSYQRRVRLMTFLLPRRIWFRAAFLISRVQDRVVLSARGRPNANAPASLNVWMVEMTRHGAFPIPQRVSGGEVLRTPGPKLIQFPHYLYYEMAVHAVAMAADPPPHVVSGPWRIEGDCVRVVGSGKALPALPAGQQLLVKIRSLFRQGESVISMADRGRGGALRPNLMVLAGKLGVPIVFVSCQLAPDGVFDIEIAQAPRPFVLDSTDLEINVRWLEEMQQRDLLHPTTH